MGQGILPRFDLSLGYGPICFEKVTKGLDALRNPLAASSADVQVVVVRISLVQKPLELCDLLPQLFEVANP